jgi:hypothetical protein
MFSRVVNSSNLVIAHRFVSVSYHIIDAILMADKEKLDNFLQFNCANGCKK